MDLKEHLKNADPSIAKIILELAVRSKEVKKLFYTIRGKAGTKNVHGEEQLHLDKEADNIFVEAFKKLDVVKTIVSEERDELIQTGRKTGFGIALDPLDGSSCVETNLSVGPIIGIYKDGIMIGDVKIIAAAYVLYGPLTILVYSVGKGTHEFVLQENGEWKLRKENIEIPEGKIYVPCGLRKNYVPDHEKLMQRMEKEGYKIRCVGSMIGDVHNLLTYGGLFCYPKLKDMPQGKLRLLFEVMPMSFIVKHAGGYATNGKEDILKIKPKKITQRTPIYIGSKKLVESIRVE